MHRIGRVPKKDSGKPRPITDCSRPYGSALNDHIKNDLVSLLFLLLKFILANKERLHKTKIRGTDKLQLLRGMLQLLITKISNRSVKLKNNHITEITKLVKLVYG